MIKGFNSIFYKHLLELARPAGATDRSALPIAGDDGAAKATVRAFLDTLGWDVVDAGPLAEGWRFQPDAPAYGHVYAGPNGAEAGVSAGVDAVRAALAAAVR